MYINRSLGGEMVVASSDEMLILEGKKTIFVTYTLAKTPVAASPVRRAGLII